MWGGHNRLEYMLLFPLPFVVLISVFWGNNVANHNYTIIVEDGKFVGDSDVGEFWSLFGGYAPIPRELPSVQESVAPSVNLFWWGSYICLHNACVNPSGLFR